MTRVIVQRLLSANFLASKTAAKEGRAKGNTPEVSHQELCPWRIQKGTACSGCKEIWKEVLPFQLARGAKGKARAEAKLRDGKSKEEEPASLG